MPAAQVSVVVICFNAADTIRRTLQAARKLSDNILVVDSGSTDDSLSIIQEEGAQLIAMEWQGFGANKNRGNQEATHDWILSIDADEVLSEALVNEILSLDLSDAHVAFRIKRLNYLNNQPIYHGGWKNDWTTRLFNRTVVQWDEVPVHENLQLSPAVKIRKLHSGWLHHYTSPNIDVYNQKLEQYATLVAEKYFIKGKKGSSYKTYLSPVYSFFKSYILYAGWLDKKAGWQIALAHARYTFKKYKKLALLRRK